MSDAAHFLALETGGTKLVAGLAGPNWRLLRTAVVKRAPGARAADSLRRALQAAADLLAQPSRQHFRLRAIGFGFGGTVHRPTNRPHLCLHEDGWNEVNAVEALEARFRAPVFVENDCKLAALAEAHFGAGAGAASVFYVTLGTGVGGGIVREGRILTCGEYGEAEIGHVVVEPHGPPCCCGGRGCVEALCSGPGLSSLCERLAAQHADAWRKSSLAADGSSQKASCERIIQAWEDGDRFAKRVVEHSLGKLAVALAAAINILAPRVVVVGGGLGTSSPRIVEHLREQVEPLVVRYFRDSYRIEPSALREAVVTQGAAILAAQRSDEVS